MIIIVKSIEKLANLSANIISYSDTIIRCSYRFKPIVDLRVLPLISMANSEIDCKQIKEMRK